MQKKSVSGLKCWLVGGKVRKNTTKCTSRHRRAGSVLVLPRTSLNPVQKPVLAQVGTSPGTDSQAVHIRFQTDSDPNRFLPVLIRSQTSPGLFPKPDEILKKFGNPEPVLIWYQDQSRSCDDSHLNKSRSWSETNSWFSLDLVFGTARVRSRSGSERCCFLLRVQWSSAVLWRQRRAGPLDQGLQALGGSGRSHHNDPVGVGGPEGVPVLLHPHQAQHGPVKELVLVLQNHQRSVRPEGG